MTLQSPLKGTYYLLVVSQLFGTKSHHQVHFTLNQVELNPLSLLDAFELLRTYTISEKMDSKKRNEKREGATDASDTQEEI